MHIHNHWKKGGCPPYMWKKGECPPYMWKKGGCPPYMWKKGDVQHTCGKRGDVHHTCGKSEFHNIPILLLFFILFVSSSNSHTGQQIDILLLMPTIIFGPQKVGVLKDV